MKLEITDNDISQAKMYRHTLVVGATSLAEIGLWATDRLAQLTSKDSRLVALSKCASQPMAIVLAILSQFEPRSEDDNWRRMTKKQVYQTLVTKDVKLHPLVSYFYNLALSGEIPAYDCAVLYQFELEYDCLLAGFAEQSEVDLRVRSFFQLSA
jgi:hypothetical protein